MPEDKDAASRSKKTWREWHWFCERCSTTATTEHSRAPDCELCGGQMTPEK